MRQYLFREQSTCLMIIMVHNKIAKMSGVPQATHSLGADVEFHPHAQCAGMSDAEMREFMKEEQKEGMHPSLKGKHF